MADGSEGVYTEAKAVELRFLVGLSEILASEKTPERCVFLASIPDAHYILRDVFAISAGGTQGGDHGRNSTPHNSTHHQSSVRLTMFVHHAAKLIDKAVLQSWRAHS